MGEERGSATVEWTALVLLVGAVLSGAMVAGGALHAPWFGRTIRCALLAGCRGEDATLAGAYGPDAAAFVRAFAPSLAYERGTLTLPVDFRNCRSHDCSDAADRAGADVWQSHRGRRATVFTRVVDRRASGGGLYIQYWLYYPDSTYSGPARRVGTAPVVARTPLGVLARKVAGHHRDDWESYQVMVRADGSVLARASAHHGYAGRRRWPNLNELPVQPRVPRLRPPGAPVRRRTAAWTPVTGWTRVSRGSHAGHIVAAADGERRTESDGLALVPIERLAPADRGRPFAVVPPWRKPVYLEPEGTGT